MATRQRPTGKKPHIGYLYSPPRDMIRALGPSVSGGREGLLHLFDTAKGRLRSGEHLRVLEIGGGSGRLAAHLIKQGEIRPEDYVLGDKAYGSESAPFLKRSIRALSQNGKMRVMPLDFEKRPPIDIGRFHVIMMPSVSGTAGVLNSMLENYWPSLQPGGLLIVNRAVATHAAVDLACGAVPRKKFNLMPHQTEGVDALLRRLTELKSARQIDFSKPGDLFVRSSFLNQEGGKTPYNDLFILQKLPK